VVLGAGRARRWRPANLGAEPGWRRARSGAGRDWPRADVGELKSPRSGRCRGNRRRISTVWRNPSPRQRGPAASPLSSNRPRDQRTQQAAMANGDGQRRTLERRKVDHSMESGSRRNSRESAAGSGPVAEQRALRCCAAGLQLFGAGAGPCRWCVNSIWWSPSRGRLLLGGVNGAGGHPRLRCDGWGLVRPWVRCKRSPRGPRLGLLAGGPSTARHRDLEVVFGPGAPATRPRSVCAGCGLVSMFVGANQAALWRCCPAGCRIDLRGPPSPQSAFGSTGLTMRPCCGRIVAAADLQPGEFGAEWGPGRGALTEQLAGLTAALTRCRRGGSTGDLWWPGPALWR